MTTPLLRLVITDANVLINLMHVSRLGLLAKIPNHEFAVPDHVREEIKLPDQRAVLEAAVGDGCTQQASKSHGEASTTIISANLPPACAL